MKNASKFLCERALQICKERLTDCTVIIRREYGGTAMEGRLKLSATGDGVAKRREVPELS